MTNFLSLPGGWHRLRVLVLLVLLPAAAARAQGPAVTRAGLAPAANTYAAPRNGAVVVPFSQPLNAATAGNITIHSVQYRGRRTATAATSGSTVTLAPTVPASGSPRADFKPGEEVQVTVPATVLSTGGAAALPYVYQFRAAATGGNADFGTPGPTVAVGNQPRFIAPADLDGDGDLDLVVASATADNVTVRLNDGAGNFTAHPTNPTPATGDNPRSVAVGDIDGDGDLDLVTSASAGPAATTVGVYLNDGTGDFTPHPIKPNPGSFGAPYNVKLGDIDGDGDLDLLTAAYAESMVKVHLNDGTGNFSAHPTTPTLPGVANACALGLGDIDADGDLDLVTTAFTAGRAYVWRNDGAGNFSAHPTTPVLVVGGNPYTAMLGDIDADGDLDLLVANNSGTSTVSVRRNDGTGGFSGTTELVVGTTPYNSALGDVDGDGDLDLVVAVGTAAGVTLRLNDGTGTFVAPTTPPVVTSTVVSVALADVNGDGALDLLAGANSTTLYVRLNLPQPVLGSFAPGRGAAGSSVTIVGTGLANATSVSFNGTAQTVITNSTGMSLTVAVPPGASTGPLTVTTPAGTSAVSSASFVVQLAVSSTSPAANATAAPRASPAVGLTFSEPVTAASIVPTKTTGIKVYSSQVGGRKAGSFTRSGSTVSYTSSLPGSRADFKPGETVSVSVPATVLSAGGVAATRKVYQFTTAVSTAGAGVFAPPAVVANGSVGVGSQPYGVVLGDVDGDGDLDLLAPNYPNGTVSLRLNGGDATGSNTGVFTAPAVAANGTISVGPNPYSLVLGDVDGDGDLDLLTTNLNSASVSLRLNGGDATGSNTGVFAAPSVPTNGTISVGTNPSSVTLGDVDGDGDLDLLTANNNTMGTVSLRLNGGNASGSNTGVFAAPAVPANGIVSVNSDPRSVTLGDVDGDGDLDLLTAHTGTTGTVSVCLNGGDATGSNTGVFAAPAVAANGTIGVGANPYSVVLGDVDGDGDLDLLTANSNTTGTVSLRLNGGDASGSNTGVFTAPAVAANGTISVDSGPRSVALGDVDGDGDLDLVTANSASDNVSVRLNGGDATGSNTGVFTAPAVPADGFVNVEDSPRSVVLGDVDGDGDLDLLAANYSSGTVSVRLNLPPRPTLTSLSTAAELPGQAVVLTGTNFTAGSTVSFEGVVASTVSYTSATSLTAVVPVGAAPGSSAVAVTTASGSASGPAFEVLQVYRSTSASGCLSTEPLVLSGSGGANSWRYLRLPGAGGAVVAAIEDTRDLGTVVAGIAALGTGTSTAVRQDLRSRRYLDRNFYLTATNASFPGQAVRVRFFGLSAELSRLTAADGNATAANLKASQYSGANEDCDLSNNDPAAERRLLAAPATIVSGADWFTAQLTVADHFSEFYLTGASSPLPVELLRFTATAEGKAARLRWATASEKNSVRFDIERSTDGNTFARIGEEKAQGTKASPSAYTYLDSTIPPTHQPTYYRLRQVDQDGTASYSPVRAVAIGSKAGLTLIPNPARSSVAVAGLSAGAVVAVFDALGRPVAQATAEADGTARLVLPAGLAPGVYIVRSGAQARRLTVE
ncbi:T9SS type A sorting domain-containing protein [Hymenobacter sp. ASUV-10]|uniref:T9SS type A sorting domain-containing protein n=1 Tax=Hymenobacter aranciens TaxID=3063996 RepID=A0ABT9BIX6_9BACT|nr:T9SS type A sorting domain-containing protein [Hymenobacter sp. ASUV-10]MDO7877628.1 T9SS type A sorting domain-containing protein [Hymenobacter sp. ASUV-10]